MLGQPPGATARGNPDGGQQMGANRAPEARQRQAVSNQSATTEQQADGQRQPWEQQPGEPDAAYVRFLVYRNLGPGRTLRLASATLTGRSATNRNKPQ
jgi:hypothetical protein